MGECDKGTRPNLYLAGAIAYSYSECLLSSEHAALLKVRS